jgi:hypothetical protein
VSGSPAVDWTALGRVDPHTTALVGAAVALGLAVLAVPWAARRGLD